MTATTMTLTDFLLARIAEDEDWAKAATPGPWGNPNDAGIGDFGWCVRGCPAGETEDSEQGRADAGYIARNHPGRVLDDLQAKRWMVDLHAEGKPGRHPAFCRTCDGLQGWPCGTLRLLAWPYSDHEDYREEWKP